MTTSSTATHTTPDTFLLGGETRVRRIGLGTMRLTDATGSAPEIWRAPADRSRPIALLRRAAELGVQLFDTADSYALGESEELVAEALAPYRDETVLATKIGNLRPSPDAWVPLGHPDYLRQQAELSLRRLRVDTIDLLYLHRLDPDYPIADQVGALAELQGAGKVRHIGLSAVTAEQLDEARRVAPIAAVQNLYNLAAREDDALVDHAADAGIAFVPFFPLAMGEHAAQGSPLDAAATRLGAAPGQVALAWLLHRAPNVVPIPGTGSIPHLEENLAATELALTPAEVAEIANG